MSRQQKFFTCRFLNSNTCRRNCIVAFPTAVPAEVFIGSVRIIVAVSLIVLVIVGDEIVESESVMRCDVVDALVRMKGIGPIIWKEIIAAIESLHQRWHHPRVAAHEAAYIIPKTAVPLEACFAGKRASKLVRACSIPWLGDQPDVCRVEAGARSMGSSVFNEPSSFRTSAEAKSKRKPSTCISSTQ